MAVLMFYSVAKWHRLKWILNLKNKKKSHGFTKKPYRCLYERFCPDFPHSQFIGQNLRSFWSFKYHVSCTDGKISLRINSLFYLFFTVNPSNSCVFFSCRPFVVNTTFSTLTIPVENVVLTTKSLQQRYTLLLVGMVVKNR